jgi:hypothetical protein
MALMYSRLFTRPQGVERLWFDARYIPDLHHYSRGFQAQGDQFGPGEVQQLRQVVRPALPGPQGGLVGASQV